MHKQTTHGVVFLLLLPLHLFSSKLFQIVNILFSSFFLLFLLFFFFFSSHCRWVGSG